MNQKQIGIILIIVGILFSITVYTFKINEDKQIKQLIQQQGGSCYLDDGTCLHEDRDYSLYILGAILCSALLILGAYLVFFDKTQNLLLKQHLEVSSALKEAKKKEDINSKWTAFVSAFSEEEKLVLNAIKEQEGIKQSTLRYRTGISKSSLSLILKSLEENNFISRKKSGKTNEIFLRKKY